MDKWKNFINIENPDEINEEDEDNFLERMKTSKLPNKPPTLHHLSQFSNEYLKKLKEILKIDSKCKRDSYCHDLKEKVHVCLQLNHRFNECGTKWVEEYELEFEDLKTKTKFYESFIFLF